MSKTNTLTGQNTQNFSSIGQPYGRDSRTATAKEMAIAVGVVGSKDASVMVEEKSLQAWKWSSFGVWVSMPGWTGTIKKTRKGFIASA